jgi:hypothetical protein
MNLFTLMLGNEACKTSHKSTLLPMLFLEIPILWKNLIIMKSICTFPRILEIKGFLSTWKVRSFLPWLMNRGFRNEKGNISQVTSDLYLWNILLHWYLKVEFNLEMTQKISLKRGTDLRWPLKTNNSFKEKNIFMKLHFCSLKKLEDRIPP